MPELPEVEEVRRSLEPHLLNVPIAAVRVHRRSFVCVGCSKITGLAGHKMVRTHRHGKKLFLIADDGQTLHLHLGMSGRVDVVPHDSPVRKHTHVVLELANGIDVRSCDPRRFGGIWFYRTYEQAHAAQLARGLGIDALELTPAHLRHWCKTRGFLKARLLSQRDVAGLGNIYVDEALWAARLHPLQRLHRLKGEMIEQLVQEVLAVLQRSINVGGTTLRDYRNVSDQPGAFVRELKVYGRGNEPCRRCGTTLKSATIAGRTTVFCPSCQKRH